MMSQIGNMQLRDEISQLSIASQQSTITNAQHEYFDNMGWSRYKMMFMQFETPRWNIQMITRGPTNHNQDGET